MDELFYDLNEASSLTGIPAATIKSRIHREGFPSVQIPYGKGRYKLGVDDKGLALLLKKPGNDEYSKLFEKYLEEMRLGIITKKPVSPDTIDTTEQGMDIYWRALDQQKSIRGISVGSLKQALMSFPVDEEKRVDRFSTKHKMFHAVTGFMRLLVRDGYKSKAELEEMRLLKPKRRFKLKKDNYDAAYIKASIQKNEEWTRGRSDFDRKLMTTLIALYAYAGLRKMEPAQLYASKVFLDKRYMLVYGKGGIEDTVIILPSLLPYLEEWEKYRKKDSRFYLTTREGEPLTASLIENRIRRFNEGPGVSIACHSLRRSFATLAAADGMPTPLIQKQLRHKHITTTQGYMMIDDTHLMAYGLKQYGVEAVDQNPKPNQPKREKAFRY